TFSQDIDPLNIRSTQRESNSHSRSRNHRASWNMEYAMDSLNYLKVLPWFSYNQSGNETVGTFQSYRKRYATLNDNINSGSGNSPSAGGNLLYNHRFRKRGRNFSVNAGIDYSDNEQNRYSNNAYTYIDSAFTPLNVR